MWNSQLWCGPGEGSPAAHTQGQARDGGANAPGPAAESWRPLQCSQGPAMSWCWPRGLMKWGMDGAVITVESTICSHPPRPLIKFLTLPPWGPGRNERGVAPFPKCVGTASGLSLPTISGERPCKGPGRSASVPVASFSRPRLRFRLSCLGADRPEPPVIRETSSVSFMQNRFLFLSQLQHLDRQSVLGSSDFPEKKPRHTEYGRGRASSSLLLGLLLTHRQIMYLLWTQLSLSVKWV